MTALVPVYPIARDDARMAALHIVGRIHLNPRPGFRLARHITQHASAVLNGSDFYRYRWDKQHIRVEGHHFDVPELCGTLDRLKEMANCAPTKTDLFG